MLNLGEYQELTIKRQAPPGLYLVDEEDNEVLLPNKYIPEDFDVGASLKVFVYLDHEERPVCTTLHPFVIKGDFAYLRCAETTDFGAFLDWGLEKHLFVSFKEQPYPMKKGMWYLIYCYLDQETNRLAASAKVNHFIDNTEMTIEPFEKVDLIVSNRTDLGFNVIINKKHLGLVYHSSIHQDLHTGDQLVGWVERIRADHKVDVVLQRPGYRSIEPNADRVMEVLEQKEGFLPLHDKSSPEEIQEALQMSKKSFKRAIGMLYKSRKIKIVPEEGIYLR